MTIEYLLVLPLLLVFLLVTLQTALLVQAWLVVHHAAQTAARSAAVVIPAAMRDRRTGHFEGANEVKARGQSPKHEFVRRSAALTLTPISREWSVQTGSSVPDLSAAPALAAVALLIPANEEGGAMAGASMALRSAYALDNENTRVELTLERAGPTAGHGTARVEVRYRYYLAVPFADRVFGQPYGGLGFFSADRYMELGAQYALPVDLRPLFPKQQRPGVYFEEVVLE